MKPEVKTIYLCGAGSKGNIGSEAVMLAIIKLFQARYEYVRFIIYSWYPERTRQVLSCIDGDFVRIAKESIFADPGEIAKSDLFVICGDVSLSETVISFLPFYFAVRTLIPKLLGKRVIFLGTEAEKLIKPTNRFAVRCLIRKTADYLIVRNRGSFNNLRKIPFQKSSLLLGFDPSLTLTEAHIKNFGYHNSRNPDSKLLVGFGLRDFFSIPLRVNLAKMKLERRDTLKGRITDEMSAMVDFTAKIANYLMEKHNARLIFIPHHFLPEKEKVILADNDIAEMVISKLTRPGDTVVIENNLHPFTALNVYKRLDLVFSMRYHTNVFAYFHGVPTFGYAISEKMVNFFKHVGREDMLLDPLAGDLPGIYARVDAVIRERDRLSSDLKRGMSAFLKDMNEALDLALKDTRDER